ncbi:hypothetical protein [Alkalihalobacillus sp. CinArs1]|uniref:hypothetical protein n=1 Tax=Alkalihalobacillus sp. CinArs1 TaxID=2995314 RepID=UPI0022DD3F2F|nr:hypothetical protein [Alkalihalobacillus sp. CinArs1]
MRNSINILLVQTILKTMFNQFLYSSNEVGVESGFTRKLITSLRSYVRISLTIIYLFWFIIAFLFQIFFHYMNLDSQQLNIVILLFGILSLCFFLGYTVNDDIRKYAMNNTFSIYQKKRVILANEYLSAGIIWIFIFLMSFPFVVGQPLLNGLNGMVFILQFLLVVLIAGYMVGFLKFFFYTLQFTYTSEVWRRGGEVLYLLLSIFIFIKREIIFESILFFIKTVLEGNLARWIIQFSPSKFSLYELKIDMLWIGTLGGVVLLCVWLSVLFAKILVREKNSTTKEKKSVPHQVVSIHMNKVRQYGLINMNFLVTFVGTLAISVYIKKEGLNIASGTMFPAYLLVSLYLSKKSTQLVLFCKRNHSSILNTTMLFLIYPGLQFLVIYLILSPSLGKINNHLTFLFGGLLLIASILFLYTASTYRFEYYFEAGLLEKLVQFLIILFLILTIALEVLLVYAGITSFVYLFVLPLLILAALYYILLTNLKHIRSFMYERTAINKDHV